MEMAGMEETEEIEVMTEMDDTIGVTTKMEDGVRDEEEYRRNAGCISCRIWIG